MLKRVIRIGNSQGITLSSKDIGEDLKIGDMIELQITRKLPSYEELLEMHMGKEVSVENEEEIEKNMRMPGFEPFFSRQYNIPYLLVGVSTVAGVAS